MGEQTEEKFTGLENLESRYSTGQAMKGYDEKCCHCQIIVIIVIVHLSRVKANTHVAPYSVSQLRLLPLHHLPTPWIDKTYRTKHACSH